jgi:hypothetical protein
MRRSKPPGRAPTSPDNAAGDLDDFATYGHPFEQVTYRLQFVSPVQAVLTGVTHAPPVPIAVSRHWAHGSLSEFTSPGVTQYSVAHALAQPPVALQMQLAMSWKNVVLPPAQSDWQQSTHFCSLSPSHAAVLVAVSVHVPPLLLPDELPLLDPLELPLLEPLLDPLELPLLDPLEPPLLPPLLPLEPPLPPPLFDPPEPPLFEPLVPPLDPPLEPPASVFMDPSGLLLPPPSSP